MGLLCGLKKTPLKVCFAQDRAQNSNPEREIQEGEGVNPCCLDPCPDTEEL